MRPLLLCTLLATWPTSLSGCGSAPSEANVVSVAGSSVANTSHAPVQLELVTCAQWDEALATQQGKIVVVDTWATWCLPCKEEFPQLVALNAKFARRGVVCMSISLDGPDDRTATLDFLKQHQAAFSNYLIQDKENAWLDKWNIKGIPIVLVFNRDGSLAKKFDKDDPDNQFTYADVEKLIAEMVNK